MGYTIGMSTYAKNLEQALFVWTGRHPNELRPKLSRNGRSREDEANRAAAKFVHQFTATALARAFEISGEDCEENRDPGTIAWFVRRLVAIADDEERNKNGSYRIPAGRRMEAIRMIRDLQALGALSHEPAGRAIKLWKVTIEDDHASRPSFNQRFRARMLGTQADAS